MLHSDDGLTLNSGEAKVSGDLSKSQEIGMSQSINQTLLQMLELKNIQS